MSTFVRCTRWTSYKFGATENESVTLLLVLEVATEYRQRYVLQKRGAPGRTRTGMTLRSADFKSAASTNFATGACDFRIVIELFVLLPPASVCLYAGAVITPSVLSSKAEAL